MGQEESNVLLVYDKEKKKTGVVKDVGDKGDFTTVAPMPENENSFMKVNAHGSIASNFLENFISQANNPWSLFRTNSKNAVTDAARIEEAMKNPTLDNFKDLEKLKVDPDKELKKNERDKELESRLDLKELEDWGVTEKQLRDNGDFKRLAQGGYSENIYHLRQNVNGSIREGDARLQSIYNPSTNTCKINLRFANVEMSNNYRGRTFSGEEMEKMDKDKNLGYPVELNFVKRDEKGNEVRDEKGRLVFDKVPCLITYDDKTKNYTHRKQNSVFIPDELGGVKLNDTQKRNLASGKEEEIPGMKSKEGNPIYCPAQYNVMKGRCEYLVNKWNAPEQDKHIFRGNSVLGAPVSDEVVKAFNAGESREVKGMTSKITGLKFDDIVSWDSKVGKFHFESFEKAKKERQEKKKQQANNQSDKKQEKKQTKKNSAKTGQENQSRKKGMKL